MPVEYSGIVAEHLAVRERAGLFDVSHMGEIEIAGKDALAAVQRISCNDASKLAGGAGAVLRPADARPARSSTTCSSTGLRQQHFLLVVNASHIPTDYAHIAEQIKPAGDAVAVDASSRYALLARAGPARARRPAAAHRRRARQRSSTTGSRTAKWPASARRFRAPATPARTASRSSCRRSRPTASGRRSSKPAGPSDVIPCGLGARDTLRLEAAMRLHGNDIDETTTAARGRSRLDRRLEERRLHRRRRPARSRRPTGVARKLVGFEMLERGIARQGYDVYVGDRDGRRA